MKTNEEHFGCKAHGSPTDELKNISDEALDKECDAIRCRDCRIWSVESCVESCERKWDVSPYGMPLDKNIPWPETTNE